MFFVFGFFEVGSCVLNVRVFSVGRCYVVGVVWVIEVSREEIYFVCFLR